ncbi:MAG TPA: hypothetical protein VMZ03_03920 [Chitinophagaceae bacterium]|nr:hypothetical protein [Chitinophagaceae bacterium]
MGIHNENNNKIGFISGLIGGVFKFLMNIDLPVGFFSKLLEAGITACVCGFLGVAGKEVFNLIKKYVLKRRKK